MFHHFCLILTSLFLVCGTLPLHASGLSEIEVRHETYQQLSLHFFNDNEHQNNFSLTRFNPPKDSCAAEYLFHCTFQESPNITRDLFVKIDVLGREFNNLTAISRYLNEHPYPEMHKDLCLPAHMRQLTDRKNVFSVLVFARAPGRSLNDLIDEYLQGTLTKNTLMDIWHRIGGTLGRLNRAGGLAIYEGELESSLVHMDLHEENIFCDPDKRLVQLIDLETMADKLANDPSSTVFGQLLYILRPSLRCFALFFENLKYPDFELIGAFIQGYISQSGLEPKDINPIMHTYCMKIMRLMEQLLSEQNNSLADVDDDEESDEGEPLVLKSKEERDSIIEEFDVYLKAILKLG